MRRAGGVSDQMLCIVTPGWSRGLTRLQRVASGVDAMCRRTCHVHFASLVLLPPRPGADRHEQPSLLFELAVDAGLSPDDLIDLLVQEGRETLWFIYGRYRQGSGGAMPREKSEWLRGFLRDHASRAACAFVGARDRTVTQILGEADLIAAAKAARRGIALPAAADRESLARALAQWVVQSGQFLWAAAAAPRSFWRSRRFALARLLCYAFMLAVPALLMTWIARIALGAPLWQAALSPLLLCLVVALPFFFRRSLDRPRLCDIPRAHQVHPSISACEARLIGRVGHMVSLTEIRRPYGWHRTMLRVWLWLVREIGHIWFTEGKLGTATGVKFGHWHFIDHGRRLLFCSNFDGSFGGYLDEFIAGASIGVNLFWRRTELRPRPATAAGQPAVQYAREFPPTRLGIFGGCTHEQWFKAYARDSMLPHVHRFEAYRYTNPDIERATRLRDALFGQRTQIKDDQIMRAIES